MIFLILIFLLSGFDVLLQYFLGSIQPPSDGPNNNSFTQFFLFPFRLYSCKISFLHEQDGSVELHAIDDEGSYFRFLVTTTSSPFHFGQTKVLALLLSLKP
jgi:hypothetical protein